jgi:hypothetical protein
VLRILDVYPGFRIQGQKDSRIRICIRIKELSILTLKLFLSSPKFDPSRIRIWIPDPDLDFLLITDPGFKKAPDTAILVFVLETLAKRLL